MSIAVISLSEQGAAVAARLAERLGDCRVHLHRGVAALPDAPRFDRIVERTAELFAAGCRELVYVAPAGAVVRAVAPCLKGKTADPAVVVVDVGGRWAVSLLSGHEGGANALAVRVANALDAEPVVTTTTEAARTIIVGVGCRRGVPADSIIEAIEASLARAGAAIGQVRLIASADIKADEPGLIEAAGRLGVPLRLIGAEQIRQCRREFARSEFVREKVNLPAVAEPAALLAGRRTTLLLPKQTFEGVTVALAAESCSWSG